jgi:hypothetical protein
MGATRYSEYVMPIRSSRGVNHGRSVGYRHTVRIWLVRFSGYQWRMPAGRVGGGRGSNKEGSLVARAPRLLLQLGAGQVSGPDLIIVYNLCQ